MPHLVHILLCELALKPLQVKSESRVLILDELDSFQITKTGRLEVFAQHTERSVLKLRSTNLLASSCGVWGLASPSVLLFLAIDGLP